jgi:hypothetical protein
MRNTFNFLVTGRQGICPELKRLGRKADHSPPCSAWIKNDYIYLSICLSIYLSMCVCLCLFVCVGWVAQSV